MLRFTTVSVILDYRFIDNAESISLIAIQLFILYNIIVTLITYNESIKYYNYKYPHHNIIRYLLYITLPIRTDTIHIPHSYGLGSKKSYHRQSYIADIPKKSYHILSDIHFISID